MYIYDWIALALGQLPPLVNFRCQLRSNMVLGPCTCSTRLCENTLNVHGCQSSSTGDYFCDGDQLFSDVNTFVYNENGDQACNLRRPNKSKLHLFGAIPRRDSGIRLSGRQCARRILAYNCRQCGREPFRLFQRSASRSLPMRLGVGFHYYEI